MNLREKRALVFISLVIQLLFTLFSGAIVMMGMPNWLMNAVLLGIPYGIWLIQIFVGRASGLTNGVSSSLLLVSYLWNIISSLNGYETALYPSVVLKLPLFYLFISAVWGLYECYVSFKHSQDLENKEIVVKKDWISLAISVVLPVFTYYSGRIPRMTLAYVDQGIRTNYLENGFLQFFTIPVIIMAILALINVVYVLKDRKIFSRKISSVGLLLGLMLLMFVSFFMPVFFWFGANPIIFSVIAICGMTITPKEYI